MIQVNRIYLIFNRLVTKKFLVDTSDISYLFNLCTFVRAVLLSLEVKKHRTNK